MIMMRVALTQVADLQPATVAEEIRILEAQIISLMFSRKHEFIRLQEGPRPVSPCKLVHEA